MNKKYILTGNTTTAYDKTLYQIKALIDIPKFGVKSGDLGGYVESEDNLSHEGSAWVADDARVWDNGKVYGDAICVDLAKVSENAKVYGNARIEGRGDISGNAQVCGDAIVGDDAEVMFDAIVRGDAKIFGDNFISDGIIETGIFERE